MPEPSLTLTASLRPAALDARRGVVTAAHVAAARKRVRPSLDPTQVAAYAAQTILG